MNIDQTCGVRAVQLTVPELQLSSRSLVSAMRAPDMPAVDMPVTATLTRGRPHAHLRQQNTSSSAGAARVKSARSPPLRQYKADVSPDMARTTSPIASFRPKWGPPSCSPPV